MSFLENLSDKPVVVLDIGHAYTKCGFAGDHGPKCIIPSEIHKNGVIKNLFDYNCENELRENLMEFMYKVYYKILNINSRERKVTIVESILNERNHRKILTDVLFKNFQVISIFYMPSHLASLFSLGLNTALVLDCGYQDIQLVPISEYYLITGLIDYINIGAKSIHNEIRKMLNDSAKVSINGVDKAFNEIKLDLSENIIEDIKIKACFVTNINRSKHKQQINQSIISDCSYNLPNNMLLNIPGNLREYACEHLFYDATDDKAIPNIILNAILNSPIDLRKNFAQNIVITGGTCMLNGFKARLISELNNLVQNEASFESLKALYGEFKIHVPPCYDNYTAWLGAAIFSTLEILDSLSIQNIKYKDNENLPDWFILSSKYKNYDYQLQTNSLNTIS